MRPQRLARIGATTAITIAGLSLLGWLAFRGLLDSGLIPAGFFVMPLSCFEAILIGISILLVLRETPGPAARSCAGFAAAIAAIVLLEYVLGVSGGPEDYLFGDAARSVLGGETPGRPSPQAALICLFLGVALWFMSNPPVNRYDVADVCNALALFIAFTVLVGHVYQARPMYESASGAAVGMSLLETMMVLVLALASLALNPQGAIASLVRDDAAGAAKRRVLPVVVVMPVLLGLMQYLAIKFQAVEFSIALSLTVTANIVVLIALTAWVGRVLAKFDEERAGAFIQRETKAKVEGKTDTLTGLVNRRGWDQTVAEAEERCQRGSLNACVIVIDLDGLKVINDTQGHAKGDEFIRRAATALKLAARREDCLARLGGDEFACLSVGLPPEHAGVLLKRLSGSLEKAGVPASLGYAMRDLAGSIAAAFQEADHAMYAHKRGRKKGAPTPASVAGPTPHAVGDGRR